MQEKRILIIDDTASYRRTICSILEQSGYEVVEAPNGNEGLKIQNHVPADLVITDLISFRV